MTLLYKKGDIYLDDLYEELYEEFVIARSPPWFPVGIT